jgi:uncharacterized protein (TIGR02466 family)
MKLEEQKIFFQSIFKTHVEPPEGIVDKIYEMAKQPSETISNRGGWQSKSYHHDEIEWMEPFIREAATAVNLLHETYGMDRKVDNASYWFNINKKGSYNVHHAHPGATFSAVWYLTAPNNCGSIQFHRPDREVCDWLEPQHNNPYNFYTWFEEPAVGKMLFFPSYLVHSVEESHSDEDRISVAINFRTPRLIDYDFSR